jgi:hypothetical protein
VVPVIVPRTFFAAGNWPDPHAHLRRVLASNSGHIVHVEDRDLVIEAIQHLIGNGRAPSNLR